MSSFEALTLAYAFFAVGLFLYFWLMSKANQIMTEVAWDAIPGVSLSHRARWMRLFALYIPHVLGYVVVAFAAGFAELQVAELARDAGAATLAKFFAFVMLLIGASSIAMNILTTSSVVKTIREEEKRAQASN